MVERFRATDRAIKELDHALLAVRHKIEMGKLLDGMKILAVDKGAQPETEEFAVRKKELLRPGEFAYSGKNVSITYNVPALLRGGLPVPERLRIVWFDGERTVVEINAMRRQDTDIWDYRTVEVSMTKEELRDFLRKNGIEYDAR